MSLVKFNKSKTYSEALSCLTDDTIYFTTDTHYIMLNGDVYRSEYSPVPSVNNVIYYTSTSGNIVTPTSTGTAVFGANIVSNVYEDGTGILTFDDDVTIIGTNAFYGSSTLSSVTIPNSVTTIGQRPFYNCTSLASINIPNSVTSVGLSAFYGCTAMTSLVLGSSVSSIGQWAFANTPALASISVNSSNSTYDSRDNCNAIITTSGNQLVAGCKNTVIPSSVTSIGYAAFYKATGLTSITLPSGLQYIYTYGLAGTGISTLTIPNSVTTLYNYSIQGNHSLIAVMIGTGITEIQTRAFDVCENLVDVIVKATTPPTAGTTIFSGCTSLANIYVPEDSVSAYQSATNWATYATKIQVQEPL